MSDAAPRQSGNVAYRFLSRSIAWASLGEAACRHELAQLPGAADRRGEEVPGAVRHAAREPPRHRRARPLLARDLRAARRQQRGAEARVEDPARLHAAGAEAQQDRRHHQVRPALQEVALPEPHGLRAALHDHPPEPALRQEPRQAGRGGGVGAGGRGGGVGAAGARARLAGAVLRERVPERQAAAAQAPGRAQAPRAGRAAARRGRLGGRPGRLQGRPQQRLRLTADTHFTLLLSF